MYGSRTWRDTLATRLVAGVTISGLGAATFMFAPTLAVLAVLMFVTGLAIAPTMAVGDQVVFASISRARATEGMTWTRVGIDGGIAIGAWAAGAMIDRHGASGGFAITATAGVLGVMLAAVAWSYVRRQPYYEEAPVAEPSRAAA